jgi:nucleotide-binding universal stress UspA family protein
MSATQHALTPQGPSIVVGYDGSPESRAALSAAAHAAGPQGCVHIVTCYDEPPSWRGDKERDEALAEAQAEARARLEALDRDPVPGLFVTQFDGVLMPGPPAEAILRVAEVRDADEIVLGSRGLGRARALLGSVSHDVLHRADRPVRIITAKAAERLAEHVSPERIAAAGAEHRVADRIVTS